MIFLGYPPGVKGYKFFDPQSCRIIVASSAIFIEFSFQMCSKINQTFIISEDDNDLKTYV